MREERSNISHQFDISHVCKNVCKKLLNVKHNWLSIRFFHNCAHMELSRKNQWDKEWLDPNCDSFKALRTVILDKTLMT